MDNNEQDDLEMIPRLDDQGYSRSDIDRRRKWIEEKTGCRTEHISSFTFSGEECRGNIENLIGSVQMPLGIAGPLLIRGQHANGVYYVPLATTEGALVRSYERGMMLLSRSGGVSTRCDRDENCISQIFFFQDISDAHLFVEIIKEKFETIRVEAEASTRYGKLLRLEPLPVGCKVIVNFCYYTADAQGMNMIMKASDNACKWILNNSPAKQYYITTGYDSEKRASSSAMIGGKGKKVIAGAMVPSEIIKTYLNTTPEKLADMCHNTMLSQLSANTIGYNGHIANGITALFIACGQDVANVANASVGITNLEVTDDGNLYASVMLPSLTVATVGGGTGLGTSRECLEMLGCSGSGHAAKFSEIIAATVLAGEISMGAAIASNDIVSAHEAYGRNRPENK